MGSIGIRHMRENGIQPMALNSLLGKLGTSDPVQLFADLNGLVDTFDIQKFGRAAAKFDEKELSSLNTACIHGMPFADAKPKLEAAGVNVAGMTDAFWDAVRPNIDKLDDVADWWAIVDGAITPVIDDEDKDYIDAAALALPDGDWTAETWGAWTASLKASTGRKGKGLFMPLRKALTGQQRGPEMAVLLPLLTREKVVARLAGAKA
jgi:glutamyl-tRNA synthetase